MKSKITSKFQVTIPKKVRERLKLSVEDLIDWDMEGGEVIVRPVAKPFLDYRGKFAVGAGTIDDDIRKARHAIAEKAK